MVMAVSLPMTCADTCITTSGSTGLTLPGMIDEPFCSSGRKISPSPQRGPLPIQAMSLAILVRETATTLSAPDTSTRASRAPCASNGSAGGGDRQAGVPGQALPHALGELAVGVEAGAGGRAAQGQLPQPDGGVGHPVAPLADLGRVARELLAQRDGTASIRWVRPALTRSANSTALAARASPRWSSAGRRPSEISWSAAA